MSTDLPDFQSAPAWMDRHGQIHTDPDLDPDMEPWLMHQRLAPFIPLRTAGEWGQHIDRDKLADVIDSIVAPDDLTTEHIELMMRAADAVLATLPELMGGAQA